MCASLMIFSAMLRSPISWLSCRSLEIKLQNAFGLRYCRRLELAYVGQSSRMEVFVHIFLNVTVTYRTIARISRSFCVVK